jgi:CrcB protein
MTTVFVVLLGGALGAPARFGIHHLIHRLGPKKFPRETFVINSTGSFLLGCLSALFLHGHITVTTKALLCTGFLGAYTTFSTFTLETVELMEEGRMRLALANVGLSCGVGLACAALGFWLGSVL